MAYNTPYKKRKSKIYEPPEEPLTEVQKARVLQKMRNICLWYINKSRKTRYELEQKLKERKYPSEFITIVLDKLEASKDIDDYEYAKYFAYSRHEYDRLGKKAIENKLRLKGVSADIIAEVVEPLDMEEETENAKYLIERRLRSTRNLDYQKRIQRHVGFLVRRGYDFGTAMTIVKEALAEEAEANEFEED